MKGFVYKLIVDGEDMVYIGSCRMALCQRKATHVYMWKNQDKTKITCSSFQLLDKSRGVCKLEQLDMIEDDDKEELSRKIRIRQREIMESDEYRDRLVNQKRSYVTEEERAEQSREKAYETYHNPEKYEQMKKDRRDRYYTNREKYSQITKNWFIMNKEHVKNYQLSYKEKQKKCVCGIQYGCDTQKHLTSEPHKKRMQLKQNSMNIINEIVKPRNCI
jgi:hypothetical protein